MLFDWADSVNKSSPSCSWLFFSDIRVQSTNLYTFPITVDVDIFIFPILISFTISNPKYSKNCESVYKNSGTNLTLYTMDFIFFSKL